MRSRNGIQRRHTEGRRTTRAAFAVVAVSVASLGFDAASASVRGTIARGDGTGVSAEMADWPSAALMRASGSSTGPDEITPEELRDIAEEVGVPSLTAAQVESLRNQPREQEIRVAIRVTRAQRISRPAAATRPGGRASIAPLSSGAACFLQSWRQSLTARGTGWEVASQTLDVAWCWNGWGIVDWESAISRWGVSSYGSIVQGVRWASAPSIEPSWNQGWRRFKQRGKLEQCVASAIGQWFNICSDLGYPQIIVELAGYPHGGNRVRGPWMSY